jgi:hypothetical protein
MKALFALVTTFPIPLLAPSLGVTVSQMLLLVVIDPAVCGLSSFCYPFYCIAGESVEFVPASHGLGAEKGCGFDVDKVSKYALAQDTAAKEDLTVLTPATIYWLLSQA